jgi:FolB domain-containing protein
MNEPQKQARTGEGGRPLDRIEIKDLLVRGIVGINETERRKRQDILLNLVMLANVRPAGESDEIDQTVNYRTVAKSIIRLVEGSSYFTVEKLATEVARLVLAEHPVAEVTVSVEKPGALRFARSVGVTITRSQSDFIS